MSSRQESDPAARGPTGGGAPERPEIAIARSKSPTSAPATREPATGRGRITSAHAMPRWAMPAAIIAIAAAAAVAWWVLRPKGLPEGFTSANGRIEATEIDISPKTAGRIREILAREGDFVTAGQVLVVMDTDVLQAQRREAVAKLAMASSAVDTARSTLAQRQSEKAAAQAVVAQREADLDLATKNFERAQRLVGSGALSREDIDRYKSAFYSAKAALSSASAKVAAADAAIATARAFIIGAAADVASVQATIERIQADIDDSMLKAPRDGRVQYRPAEPGEVLAAGGRVLNLVDLGDVYMTFFLPTATAGRVTLGAEVRLVLDAAPEWVIPAHATYVADVAQFTPKTVETAEERLKLVFRIKAHIAPELLRKYVRMVKTGLPGMAYVRLDPHAEWPSSLQVRLPEPP